MPYRVEEVQGSSFTQTGQMTFSFQDGYNLLIQDGYNF